MAALAQTRKRESAKAERLLRRVLNAKPPVLSAELLDALRLAVSLLEARKYDAEGENY